jgi:hypothetical protein
VNAMTNQASWPALQRIRCLAAGAAIRKSRVGQRRSNEGPSGGRKFLRRVEVATEGASGASARPAPLFTKLLTQPLQSGRAACDWLRFRAQGRRAFCAASTTMTRPAALHAGRDAALVVRRRATGRFGRTAIVVARKVLDAVAGAAARPLEQTARPRLYVLDSPAAVAVVTRTREYCEQPQRHRQRHPHPHDAGLYRIHESSSLAPFGAGYTPRSVRCVRPSPRARWHGSIGESLSWRSQLNARTLGSAQRKLGPTWNRSSSSSCSFYGSSSPGL